MIDLRGRGSLPPTLAQINSRNTRNSTKRPKRESDSTSTSTYHQSDQDLTFSLGDRHPLSATEDSFEEEDEVPDPLSASFKSLYKSIFGHSVSSGEYLNPPPLPPCVLTDLGSSDSSIPLGASALSLLSLGAPITTTTGAADYSPHFYTLMDSFRDIAESNSWDNLEPEQVQGLMQSFKAVERDRLGLDDESYSRVSSSFEHFLQQLSCRFVAGGEGGRDHHAADMDDYQSNLPGSGGCAAQPLVDSLPPNYPENPELFPISGTSPPSANYPSQPLAIDPPSPTRPESTAHTSPHAFTSDNPHTTQLFPPSSTPPERRDFKFLRPTPITTSSYQHRVPVAMDRLTGTNIASGNSTTAQTVYPFGNDDDDDFDWSTIM